MLTNKVNADGKGTAYAYTPDGKLATRTWARGITTSYGYTPSRELLTITYSDGTPSATYTYDRIGRQISAITAGVSTNLFAYDALTLALTNETVIAFGETNVLSRLTDSLSRPAGLSLSNPDTPIPPYTVTYSYDAFGRFHSVSSSVYSVSSVVNYSYLPGSHLISGYTAGNFTRAVTYEPHRDLIVAVSNTWGGTLVSAFDYTNDALGRRTARADGGSAFASTQANAFGYNARSEVASAAMRNGESTYTFDPIGNRTEATLPDEPQPLVYASNPLNQYTNIVAGGMASEPLHDADGNMLSGPAGPDGAMLSLVWDGENRLIAVTNGNTIVLNDYDYRSRRIRKRVVENGVLSLDTHFLYDGWNLVHELAHSQTHTLTNFHVWGLDLSGSLQGAGGVGGLLSVHTSPLPLGEGQGEGGVFLPCFDGNGNVSEYNDTEGVVVAHYEYDVFGRTVVQSGPQADAFAHRFSTKHLDSETGLYYYGYKNYSPELGRWPSHDPIEEEGSLGLYVFVKNNPLDLVDVSGMWPWSKKYELGFSTGQMPEGTCGGGLWKIAFVVTPKKGAAKPNGLIVQKIKLDENITTCCKRDPETGEIIEAGTPYHTEPWKSLGKTMPVTFWEPFVNQGMGWWDQWGSTGPMPNTRGSMTFEGTAWWHQGTVDVSSVFPVTPPGFPGPITWTDPSLKRHSNELKRKMIVTWNCCKDDPDYVDDKSTFVISPASGKSP